MIEYEQTKICKYENFVRDIANSFVQRLDFEKLERQGKTFLGKAKERFCFDSEDGWKFLTSCLDTIGDSHFAIVYFKNARFDAKEDTVTGGEHYLRLYGVLSAVYIQQQSIIKLCDLFKVKNLNDIKEDFSKQDITFLRHCISAHPINFSDSNKKVGYKIERCSINNWGNLGVRDDSNISKIYNIFDSLDKYLVLAEKTLEKVCSKMIENTCKTTDSKKEELIRQLTIINNGR